MGTTTNNGWTYPESTDLVKDGATAIETLATDIDTTLGVYAPSSSGLELINTTSFSGVSTQSINDVFSATYKNYRIVYTAASNTGFNALTIRLRAAGTDNTSSNYFFGFHNVTSTGGSGVINNSTGTTSWYVGEQYDRNTIIIIDINSPFATDYTTFWANSTTLASNTVQSVAVYGGGGTTVTTSYDGFTLFPSGNTLTGEVSIYGYNK